MKRDEAEGIALTKIMAACRPVILFGTLGNTMFAVDAASSGAWRTVAICGACALFSAAWLYVCRRD